MRDLVCHSDPLGRRMMMRLEDPRSDGPALSYAATGCF